MTSLLNVMSVRMKALDKHRIIKELALNGWQAQVARNTAPSEYEYIGDVKNLDVGDVWGRQGQTVFMRKIVEIPKDWAGARACLEILTGGEGLLRINGEPYHGIDDNRGFILLNPECKGGESYDCEIEIKTGGYWEYVVKNSVTPYILSKARLVSIDPTVERAFYDFKVVYDAAATETDSTLSEAILLAIKESLHNVDFRDMEASSFGESLLQASDLLREKLSHIGSGKTLGKIFFNGFSHIDVAWLWPLKETVRKAGRTYSTVMALMDEYPYYYFNCSQAPLFLFLKEHYPTLYKRVKERVAEGRFEPIGGTWVENDCNVVSGESLVRQCLYGQRFFRKEFGVNVRVGWLPDVFGYSWAMPQIYKKSGLDYFMTEKLCWNDTNKFPHSTFWWQGIDGTRILTYFLEGCFSAMVQPKEVRQNWSEYKSKLDCPEFLSTYGHGDGGGGPTREMLEYLPRMKNIPGLPSASTGRVHDWFDRVAANSEDLPVWNGEFYFELHRGTYTSQARNKRYNRQSELLYREAEMYNAFCTSFGKEYPRERLVSGWETILLNQFHDVIPGSSIAQVYEDSTAQYKEVLAVGNELKDDAVKAIALQADTTGPGIPVVVLNSLSWKRGGIASVKVSGLNGNVRVEGPDGGEVPCQVSGDVVSFETKDVPPCGYAVYRILEGEPTALSPFVVDGQSITTPYYELTLNSEGQFTRVYDRINSREVLPEGARANVLEVFEDKPSYWDAWDIELQYQDKVWEFHSVESPEVVENGQVKLVLRTKSEYGKSTIEQKIVLYADSPRIDFVNEVDWEERCTLLKAAFPVQILSTRATYETAFGAVERPTHWNTSWDIARFEVCGHRWADLSEADYGVSILNDCKYGWDIKDNVMRLTLLRSSIDPDPEADKGRHEFAYSLLPHAGDWKNCTVQCGMELNVPLDVVVSTPHPGKLSSTHSFMSSDRSNVIIDTVKEAEDDDTTIVRVYEAHGARGPVNLSFDRPLISAVECDLLEENYAPVDFSGSQVRFSIKPFEIRTLKLRFAAS